MTKFFPLYFLFSFNIQLQIFYFLPISYIITFFSQIYASFQTLFLLLIILYSMIQIEPILRPQLKRVVTNTSYPQLTINDQNQLNSGRRFGVQLIVLQALIIIIYGIVGQYYKQANINSISQNQLPSILIFLLFIIIGFGLLLSVYQNGTWIGVSTSIFVVSLSLLLNPLLQKFWFLSMFTSFGKINIQNAVHVSGKNLTQHLTNQKLEISTMVYRIALLSCVSILTLITSIIGRVNFSQIMKITIIYQIFWTLSYTLSTYLCIIRKPETTLNTPFFFDQYGATYNYLFASVYGLILTHSLKKQQILIIDKVNNYNRFSLIMSILGSGFLFATFMFSYSNTIESSPKGKNLLRFNVLWAMITSLIGSYIVSFLLNKGKVGCKEAIIGILNGGITMSFVSPFIHNIGIVFMLGLISGGFSSFYFIFILPKINKEVVKDVLGLFGSFTFSSFFGSFVLTPLVLSYYSNTRTMAKIGLQLFPSSLIGWQLSYIGIAIAFGSVGGLLGGLSCYFDKQVGGLASNSLYFTLHPKTDNEQYEQNNKRKVFYYHKTDEKSSNNTNESPISHNVIVIQ